MLILILIDVHYLQNVVFCFEKDLNGQNCFLPDSHYPIKRSTSIISHPPSGGNSPILLNAIWKKLVQGP